MMSHIKEINRLIDDISKLTTIPEIESFKDAVDKIEEAFNSLRDNPETFNCASDYDDLLSKLKAEIETACTDFQTTGDEKILDEIHKIKVQSDYSNLKDEQKAVIDAEFDNAMLSFNEHTVAQLREMINDYVSFKMGGIDKIRKHINDFSIKNLQEEAEKDPDNQTADTDEKSSSPKQPIRRAIKRKIQTRAEAEEVIDFLKEHVTDLDAGTPLELSLSE